jgi:hypothetical protein
VEPFRRESAAAAEALALRRALPAEQSVDLIEGAIVVRGDADQLVAPEDCP